jgi:DNA-binding MarR family transcriptional regulator
MAQLVEQELAADGVDPNGYAVLSLIGVRAHMRLTELAAELGMPITTASDVVRRLEQRRLVRRSPNPDDGRSSLFALTASGDREWRNGWPALQRINRALEQHLEDPDGVRAAVTALDSAFAAALAEEQDSSLRPRA